VATDYFGVRVYTDQRIGETQETASGANASAAWSGLASNASYEWYAVAQDEHEGYTRSDIWRFYTGKAPGEPETVPGGGGTVPGGNDVKDGTVSVKPGANGSFSVTEADVNEAINGATDNYVDIALQAGASTEGELRLELPASAIKALQESGKTLRVIAPGVTIEYPKDSLPAHAGEGQGKLVFTMDTEGNNAANDAVADAANRDSALHGTGIVYELGLSYVESNGESTPIREFGEEVAVTRTLTTEELEGLDKDYAGVYYLNGEEAVYMGGAFDGNIVTFKTTHFSSYAVMEYRKPFADMNGHWAKDFVGKLAARHAITGIDGTRYVPDRDVTRADFAVIAVKALGFLGLDASSSKFADVAADKYYAAYVDKARELGLVAGYNGQFRPEDTITREEAAVILMRVYAYQNDGETAAGGDSAFADIAEASEWARQAIEDAKELGLVNGKGQGLFDPHADVTRAEIAKMIWLAIQ
ncbi:MAG: hypothetical protein K0Q63_226, partial [Paenibacillus sp.]|nr:hypothetical protein [Paenibacillus sp.]